MMELTRERLRELLPASSIVFAATATGRDDAVRQAAAALAATGAVGESYLAAMLERERSISTYVGEGIAMPHGTINANQEVNGDALVLLRFPDGIDWGGETVTVVFGVAAHGRGYIALISQIAAVLLDPARAASLRAAESVEEIYTLFD